MNECVHEVIHWDCPVHDPTRAFGLDARDQGRGRQIIHGREELGKGDVFCLGAARILAGPAFHVAIRGVIHHCGNHRAADARHRARSRCVVEEIADGMLGLFRPRATAEINDAALA